MADPVPVLRAMNSSRTKTIRGIFIDHDSKK